MDVFTTRESSVSLYLINIVRCVTVGSCSEECLSPKFLTRSICHQYPVNIFIPHWLWGYKFSVCWRIIDIVHWRCSKPGRQCAVDYWPAGTDIHLQSAQSVSTEAIFNRKPYQIPSSCPSPDATAGVSAVIMPPNPSFGQQPASGRRQVRPENSPASD